MKRIIGSIASLVLCAPLLAQAAEGYVVADISLQSGPDTEYPSITELSAGMPVDIQGCINGWTWCDVIVGEDRGWVPGTFLQETYDNQRVYITDYGARIGIPIVAFSLGVYWDQHYRNRSWYGQRSQWQSRHFSSRAPSRPANIENAPRQGQERARSGDATRQAPAQQTVTTQQQQPRTVRTPAPAQQQAPMREAQPAAVEQSKVRDAGQQKTERAQQVQRGATETREPQQRAEEVKRNAGPAHEANPKAQPKPKQEQKPEKEKDNKDKGGDKDKGGG